MEAAEHNDRSKLYALLMERVSHGKLHGNGRAVNYPDGLDFDLTKLLDDLRRFQVRVRVELHDERLVRDGHLRRVAATENAFENWDGSLGLFTEPDDRKPKHVISDGDYPRLDRITCIDRLLLGRGQPRVLWEAHDDVRDERERSQRQRLRRERLMAGLFSLHVLVVIAAVIVLAIPALTAAMNHEVVAAIAWGTIWWTVSVVAGTSVAAWENARSLTVSLLWRGSK